MNAKWDEIKRLKGETALLNFKCEFIDGKCITSREHPEWGLVKCGCCCSMCASAKGYLYDRYPKEDKPIYDDLFDLNLGFWRKGKGCILPREMRSVTCLRYFCHPSQAILSEENAEKLSRIMSRVCLLLNEIARNKLEDKCSSELF